MCARACVCVKDEPSVFQVSADFPFFCCAFPTGPLALLTVTWFCLIFLLMSLGHGGEQDGERIQALYKEFRRFCVCVCRR